MNGKIKKYYNDRYKKRVLIEKYMIKRNEDIIYKIIDNLLSRAQTHLRKKRIERNMTHMKLIGCTPMYLKKYWESQFKNGMNYDNYGEWEVDHIKPISVYNLHNILQLKECFNHKNLQPLWKIENIKKSNKYSELCSLRA